MHGYHLNGSRDARYDAPSICFQSDHRGCSRWCIRSCSHNIVTDAHRDAGICHGRSAQQFGHVPGVRAEDNLTFGINLYRAFACERKRRCSALVSVERVVREDCGLIRDCGAVYLYMSDDTH